MTMRFILRVHHSITNITHHTSHNTALQEEGDVQQLALSLVLHTVFPMRNCKRIRSATAILFSLPGACSFTCFASRWTDSHPVVPSSGPARTRQPSALYDLSEWRDLIFDFPGTGDDRRLGTEQGAPPREICVLPFPYPEVLLQGETKQLRLYEDRFIQLFEDTMENHRGVVAMGLIADSGIIQTVPICEIEAYNRMGDGFGIFVTIRVVSRAQLIEINQQEPYIKAICTEIADKLPPNLQLPNLVATNIESFMLNLSSMERQLEQVNESTANEESGALDDTRDEKDAIMQRRITIAKLNDRFYNDDDDDDDNDVSVDPDRIQRFRKAYDVAISSDMQGYRSLQQDEKVDRTPQELTAISWAAFSTELLPEEPNAATFRIQALDSDDVFERLKLALHMLRQKKIQVRAKLESIQVKGDDLDDDELSKS